MNNDAFLEALFNLPTIPAYWPLGISDDGKWVAWTWYNIGPTSDVYVAPTDGSQPPLRLTNTAQNTHFLGWAHDNRTLLVAQDEDGNERDQIFRIDRERPFDMIALTPHNPNYYARYGGLHPNGNWLVYGANVDPRTGKKIEPTYLWRQDLTTGERKLLARPQRGGWIAPTLSPTGEHVLYSRNDRHPAGKQVWLVDINGNFDRELFNFGDEVKAYADWFPDGRRLLVMAEMPTHMKVGVWEMRTGQIRWLIDDPARNIENAYAPRHTDQIVVIEVQQARNRCSLLDPATGAETALPDIPGNLNWPMPTGQDGSWLGMYFSSQQPIDIVRFPIADPQPSQFASVSRIWDQTPIRASDLAKAENFTWKADDGLPIQGWLYRAPEPARGTVVYVHGGPTAHSMDSINPQIQFFVRQGFNVLDPNYRGSTGFSMTFREAIKIDGWGGREQDDIRAGIEALIAAGIAQRGKVGITGTSYGGYSSWCAITHYGPDIIAASAPICGMTDLVVDYETTRPDLRPYSEEMLGGSPSQAPQRYFERSPINFVQNIKGHLLIVQGMQDPNVTPENVRAVTGKLRDNGIEYQLLPFEDEGHGIMKPANRKVLFKNLAEFFGTAFAG